MRLEKSQRRREAGRESRRVEIDWMGSMDKWRGWNAMMRSMTNVEWGRAR